MGSLKFKRLIAMCIDFIIIVLISTMFTYIITLGRSSLSAPIIYQLLSIFIYLCTLIFLIIVKDLPFKNASFGKKILGLGIFNKDGSIPDKKILTNRNKSLFPLFPLDIISIILRNETSGDREYNTKVDFVRK